MKRFLSQLREEWRAADWQFRAKLLLAFTVGLPLHLAGRLLMCLAVYIPHLPEGHKEAMAIAREHWEEL